MKQILGVLGVVLMLAGLAGCGSSSSPGADSQASGHGPTTGPGPGPAPAPQPTAPAPAPTIETVNLASGNTLLIDRNQGVATVEPVAVVLAFKTEIASANLGFLPSGHSFAEQCEAVRKSLRDSPATASTYANILSLDAGAYSFSNDLADLKNEVVGVLAQRHLDQLTLALPDEDLVTRSRPKPSLFDAQSRKARTWEQLTDWVHRALDLDHTTPVHVGLTIGEACDLISNDTAWALSKTGTVVLFN